jgi:hypothetical protein
MLSNGGSETTSERSEERISTRKSIRGALKGIKQCNLILLLSLKLLNALNLEFQTMY